MIYHILTFSIGISTGLLISLFSKKFYTDKKKKWLKLTKLVSINHKNKLNVYRVSIMMFIQLLYLNILQYLNSTIRKIKHNKYELTYNINGKIYKLLIYIKKGPRSIEYIHEEPIKVTYEKITDVTSEILPFVGPGEKFHGIVYTPKMFNKNCLVFEMIDGTSRTFRKNDPIIFF